MASNDAQNDRRIDYVEFNVADIGAAKTFYGAAFGWRFTDYGENYCEFDDGRLKGGFTNLSSVRAAGGPLVILYAEKLEDVLSSVEKAGGTIAKPITAFPGGRRFHFVDKDGYELAVWSKD
jgi:predicted enzyme related to lactoylglutathione lyase